MIRRDGAARICRLSTKHGTVETPLLMPVVNPNVLTLSTEELREIGADALITNGYIIMNDPELKQRAMEKGLHTMLGWEGPIMTDSGAFQTHVYGDGLHISSEDVLDFQVKIGSDICTILDLFSEPEDTEQMTREKIQGTIERARAAIERYGPSEPLISCPIQGSLIPQLRERCAQELSELGASYMPIGGVVPLMESYRFADLVDVILSSRRGAAPSAPLHLFGCGHPLLFPLAVMLGCDVFDSAAYVKYAKMGRVLTPEGTIDIEEFEYPSCGCKVCATHTSKELRALPQDERTRALSYHNLHVSLMEVERTKQAIASESLWDYAMTRCRSHPKLYEGARRVLEHYEDLEGCEPLYRKTSLMYTGEETHRRPCVVRLRERIKASYRPPDARLECVIDEPDKPYMFSMRSYIEKYPSVHFSAKTWMGTIPLELDSVYPVSQSLIPSWVEEADDAALQKRVGSEPGAASRTPAGIGEKGKEGSKLDWDALIAKAICEIQFGPECADELLRLPLEFVKSRKTGRIRNVRSAGEHVLSLRAEDGYATLKLAGGKRMLSTGRWRVVANQDASEFVPKGRNLFCKFVIDCDPQVRPRDEVLIVDEKRSLLAVGQSAMNAREMLSFKRGVAVYVREGTDSNDNSAE
jgi:7-cyano-7-deazaguanine tRNA-ribosyltransferase